jgi:hypothetical protein
MVLMSDLIDREPSSFQEASKQQVWRDAMVEEHASIMKNDVWEVVPRPEASQWLGLVGSIRSSMLQITTLRNSKPGSWLRGSLKKRELTMTRHLP